MTINAPFYPKFGSGQNATAAAASASITIGKGNKQIRIINTGTNPFQFRIGVGAQTATAADAHVSAGSVETFSINPESDTLAHISSAGTTFNIMTGEGF